MNAAVTADKPRRRLFDCLSAMPSCRQWSVSPMNSGLRDPNSVLHKLSDWRGGQTRNEIFVIARLLWRVSRPERSSYLRQPTNSITDFQC